ncbi:hypothetical protein [Catellatospora sichuanensis]|uniref:hypothetical protein n=1 Tax=Catellatospora sichuanensis TaxID=1969805 RepID=UPI001181DEB4|nr:hypothetical protein [Catellatospora sichuanensis]
MTASAALSDRKPVPLATETMTWRVHGEVRRLLWRGRTAFDLTAVDTAALSSEPFDEPTAEAIANADALVMLYELGDDAAQSREAFRLLTAEAMAACGARLVRSRLPHPLAVITLDFDRLDVLRHAIDGRWLNQAPTGRRLPCILDRDALGLLRSLSASTEFDVPKLVQQKFVDDRVSYHASSARGFPLIANENFDPVRLLGVSSPADQGDWQPPLPINVLEPIIRIHRAAQRSSRTARLTRGRRP